MNAPRLVLARAVSTLLAAGAASSVAWGDDVAPAYRGAPQSVWVEWEFQLPPADVSCMKPEWFSATGDGTSYAGAAPHAETDDETSWMWVSGDMDGALRPKPGTGGAMLAFTATNRVTVMPVGVLRLRVTWIGGTAPVTQGAMSWSSGDDPACYTLLSRVWLGEHGFYEDWVVNPSPRVEWIVIDVPEGTAIDSVLMDTWATIPAPAGSLALVGVALLVLGHRRRSWGL